MDTVRNLTSSINTETSSLVTPTAAATGTVTPAVASNDFDNILKVLLPQTADNNVSEEELFAGLARERVMALKGDEGVKKFDAAFAAKKGGFTKGDGFVAYEGATVAALKKLTASGTLTKEEGDAVYSQAFAGAQLDSNTSALWDRRGGANDPTMAIEKLDAALKAARTKIDTFAAGTTQVTQLSLASAADGQRANLGSLTSATTLSSISGSTAALPTGTIKARGAYIDGANGFLFKPISSNEGRLAVLLPESMAHLVDSVVLKDSKGKVIEKGRSVSFGDTGTREKISFSRQGGSYPKKLTVEVKLQDGSVVNYKIPDPSKRYD